MRMKSSGLSDVSESDIVIHITLWIIKVFKNTVIIGIFSVKK